MKALVFGSLNIDYVYRVPHFVERGETLASSSFQRFCGGKGLNQAIALSRAGMQTWMAGAVGEEGGFLLEELRKAGVNTDCVARSDAATGHAIIQNSMDGDNCILLFGGANRCIGRAQIREVLAAFGPGDLLLVQNEINLLEEIVRQAKDKGMLVALNPSPMEKDVILPLLPYADILIVNRIEAEQLCGVQAAEPDVLLRELGGMCSAKEIVLTLGEEGSLLWLDGVLIRQSALPVHAVDTTGAGDSFTGFFLTGLLLNKDPVFALHYAAAAAALAVTRAGAAASIPKREEVLRFMDENEQPHRKELPPI